MIRVRRKEQGDHGTYGADLVHSEDDSGQSKNAGCFGSVQATGRALVLERYPDL